MQDLPLLLLPMMQFTHASRDTLHVSSSIISCYQVCCVIQSQPMDKVHVPLETTTQIAAGGLIKTLDDIIASNLSEGGLAVRFVAQSVEERAGEYLRSYRVKEGMYRVSLSWGTAVFLAVMPIYQSRAGESVYRGGGGARVAKRVGQCCYHTPCSPLWRTRLWDVGDVRRNAVRGKNRSRECRASLDQSMTVGGIASVKYSVAVRMQWRREQASSSWTL